MAVGLWLNSLRIFFWNNTTGNNIDPSCQWRPNHLSIGQVRFSVARSTVSALPSCSCMHALEPMWCKISRPSCMEFLTIKNVSSSTTNQHHSPTFSWSKKNISPYTKCTLGWCHLRYQSLQTKTEEIRVEWLQLWVQGFRSYGFEFLHGSPHQELQVFHDQSHQPYSLVLKRLMRQKTPLNWQTIQSWVSPLLLAGAHLHVDAAMAIWRSSRLNSLERERLCKNQPPALTKLASLWA